jgi:hypothetical protein
MDAVYDDKGRLRGCFVHRAAAANVLLGSIERVREGEDVYTAQMVVDPAHPFFFEHPLDHVPSMMLIEAGRQLGIAVAHIFLDVPFGTAFAPTAIAAEFTRYGELDAPVTVQCEVRDKVVRRKRLHTMALDGSFHQSGRVFGTMSGRWTMIPADLHEVLRRSRGDR